MQKGFSLVEILVSIAIITILSGFGIQAFATAQQRARLEEDVATVVQAIRKAQNSALAPSKSETGVITEKLCSMGVSIDGNNNSIKQFYTITCGSAIDYSPPKTTQLKYSNITPSNINFEFIIPFADVSTGGNITIQNGALSKTIEVTDSGLIKVQ